MEKREKKGKANIMIRILQSVNIMDRAGLETMLMNYYRNIDRTKIQFDFLTHRAETGAYDEEIKNLGGKIYHAPRLYPQNYIQYFNFMNRFFEEHPEYLIVHSHIDSMSYFPLLAAKKKGVPVRIGHSHNSKLDKDFKYPIKYFALKKMPTVANEYFACGKMAGEFMWTKQKFNIVHNAIELDKFAYNEELRRTVRNKLKISDSSLVIGHVGRFNYVKNQVFLIDVFCEIVKEKPDSLLILVGKGEDEEKIRCKIHEAELEDKVLVLIDRLDVDRLYQAFDIFVMPSLFEGLPVVGVEAQANGLPCVFSKNVSEEVILTHNAERFLLNNNAKEWADLIIKKDIERNADAVLELSNSGYDIRKEAKKLENWYLKKYEQLKEEQR